MQCADCLMGYHERCGQSLRLGFAEWLDGAASQEALGLLRSAPLDPNPAWCFLCGFCAGARGSAQEEQRREDSYILKTIDLQ